MTTEEIEDMLEVIEQFAAQLYNDSEYSSLREVIANYNKIAKRENQPNRLALEYDDECHNIQLLKVDEALYCELYG